MPGINFGSVKAADFLPVAYQVDSSAEAVCLFDAGSVYFHELDYKRFEMVALRHKRIRILNPPLPEATFLSPNSVTDSIVTEINLQTTENKATISTTFGRQSSVAVKTVLKSADEKEKAQLLKNILFADAPLTDATITGRFADSSITFTYHLPAEPCEDNTVYFSPLLSLQMKSNPFPVGQRVHDTDLPHCREDVFHVVMNVPEGYEVDEMPKPVTVSADDIHYRFTYSISVLKGNRLETYARISIGKAIFEPENILPCANFIRMC